MNVFELMTVAESMTEIKTVLLASQWEGNDTIAKIKRDEGFPLLMIGDEIPSTETVGNDGFINTVYLPEMMLLSPEEIDENSLVKIQSQEELRTIIRKLIFKANNSPETKKTGRYIARANIGGMLDTDFDDGLIGCKVVLEIPHIDFNQSC
jgi:hypothetical protein